MYGMNGWNKEIPGGDTISRAAAIDAFLTELTKRERKNFLHTWSTVEVKYFVADMLEKLPSAQPDVPDTNVGDMMSRLDTAISNAAYILDALMAYRNIVDSGDCNRCGKKKTCEYVPNLGQLVRYNCPFYEQEGEG